MQNLEFQKNETFAGNFGHTNKLSANMWKLTVIMAKMVSIYRILPEFKIPTFRGFCQTCNNTAYHSTVPASAGCCRTPCWTVSRGSPVPPWWCPPNPPLRSTQANRSFSWNINRMIYMIKDVGFGYPASFGIWYPAGYSAAVYTKLWILWPLTTRQLIFI